MTRLVSRLSSLTALSAISVLLMGCAISTEDLSHINTETKFTSADYGVAASPRLTKSKSIKRGGGRYHVGKPYKIAGKWYHPKVDEDYEKVGIASWYGPNFHGRLTANGEIFDQMALSAAHPTLPLPSYVRVTNQENGKSVLVRVNDRGPFAHGRIIDLSRRSAEVLGVIANGTAKVKIKYIGRANLDGHDDWLAKTYVEGPSRAIYAKDRAVVAQMTGKGSDFGSAIMTGSIGEIGDDEEAGPSLKLPGDISLPRKRPMLPANGVKALPLEDDEGKPMLLRLKGQDDEERSENAYAPAASGDIATPFAALEQSSDMLIGAYMTQADAELVAARVADYASSSITAVTVNGQPAFAVYARDIPSQAHLDAVKAKIAVMTR